MATTGLALAFTRATHSHSNNTDEQTIFTVSNEIGNKFMGAFLDMSELTQNVTVRVKYAIDGSNLRTFQSFNWTTGQDDGVFIEGEIPFNDTFRVTIQSASAEGAARDVNYQYCTEGLGAGAQTFTYTVTDSVSSDPLQGVEVWISTDASGNNIVFSGFTDSNGQVVAYLDAGTWYVFRAKDGYTFSNPDVEVIS